MPATSDGASDAHLMSLPRSVHTLVVGAGFGGLAAAIALRDAGFGDFLVIDKGSEVGGTWRDNTYPGAACDVPSQLYSLSYAPNPDWSRSFSPQPEIQEYLRKVARESGVLDRFRFGVTLLAAHWDEVEQHWEVETTAGSVTADVLVPAAGALSEPKMPDLPGLDRFRGRLFHSARWDHDQDLTGARIAVIGTGASAIQIVPEVAGIAARVDVYQRTAPWVMPRRDRALSRIERALYRTVPAAQRLVRAAIYLGREATVPMFTSHPALGRLAQRGARRNIARGISDPELRRRVTPHFALGCKRVLLSNDWYPALSRDNVDLVTASIDQVTETGIVTSDGIAREVDAIVVATGFTPTEIPIAEHIAGKGGRTLSQAWAEHGMRAYKGAAVPGFPNLFFIVGPNTGLGHSSMVFMIESQVAYLVDALRTMRLNDLVSVEVTEPAHDEWNTDLQRRMPRTVWSRGGCASWYLDRHGRNVTMWPRSTLAFRRLTARFDVKAYLTTARQPAALGQAEAGRAEAGRIEAGRASAEQLSAGLGA